MKTNSCPILLRCIALISTAFLLAGCWTQSDTISIRGNGAVEFTSQVTIADKSFKPKDVDEISAECMKAMIRAGWKIERKILTTTPPYHLTFTGSGDLKKVKTESDFYHLTKISDKEFQIRFVPAESKGGKSSRSITFSKALLASDALVTDSSGKSVTKIDNVQAKDTYTIKLD